MAKRTVVKDGYRYTYEGDRLVRVDKVETPKVQSQKDADRSARARKNYSGNQTAKVSQSTNVEHQEANTRRSAKKVTEYMPKTTTPSTKKSNSIERQEANSRRSAKKVSEYFPNAKKKRKPLTQMTDEEYNMRRSLREFEAYMANKEEYEFATKKRTKTGDELDWIMSDTYKKERGEKFGIDHYHNDFVDLLKDYDEIGRKFGNEYIDPKEMAEFTKKVNAFYARTDLMKEYMDIYGVDYSPMLQEMYSAISGEMDVIKNVTDNANKANSQYNSAEEFRISKITDYEGLRNKRDYYEELAKAASGDQKIHYESLVDYINEKIASPELASTMTPDDIESEKKRFSESVYNTMQPGRNVSYTPEGYMYYDYDKAEKNLSDENSEKSLSAKFDDAVKESEALRLIKDYTNRTDFESLRSALSPKYTQDNGTSLPNTSENEAKLIYNAVNGDSESIGMQRATEAILDGRRTNMDFSVISTMTGDEIDTYNYIVNTQGLEAGSDFVKKLSGVLNKRKSGELSAEAYKYAQKHPFLSLISGILSSPVSAIGDLTTTVSDIYNGATGKGIDIYDERHRGQNISSAMSQGGQSAFESPIAQFLYGTAESGGKEAMLYATTLGIGKAFNLGGKALGAINMAAHSGSAFEGKLIQYKEEGYSDASALIAGLVSAGIEAATEALPMDRLLKTPDVLSGMNTKKIVQIMKRAGVSGIEEGLEEGASMILGDIYDIATNHEKLTAYYQAYNKAIKEGKGEKEATVQGFLSAIGELGQNVLAGAFVGMGMSASNSASVVIRSDKVRSIAENYFRDNGSEYINVATLLTQFGMPADTETLNTAKNLIGLVNGKLISPELRDSVNNTPELRGVVQALANIKAEGGFDTEETVDNTEPVETSAPTDIKDKPSDLFTTLTSGKLSSNQIDGIIDNPDRRQEFQELTGITLEGSKAKQRNIIKEWIRDKLNIEEIKLKKAGFESLPLLYEHSKVNDLLENPNSKNVGEILYNAKLARAFEELIGQEIPKTFDGRREFIRENAELARRVYAESEKTGRGTIRQSLYRNLDELTGSADTIVPQTENVVEIPEETSAKETVITISTEDAEREALVAIDKVDTEKTPETRGRAGTSAFYEALGDGKYSLVNILKSKGYSGSEAVSKAIQIFDFAYESGRKGYDKQVTISAISNYIAKGSDVVAEATYAFESGVADSKTLRGKKGNGLIKNSLLKDLQSGKIKNARISSRTVRAIDAISQKLGLTVQFVDYIRDSKGKIVETANASFNTKTGKIEISIHAKNHFMTAMIHESIHAIRSIDPEQYNKLSDIVYQTLTKTDYEKTEVYGKLWRKTLADYRAEATKNGNVNKDLITEEIVANVVSSVFTDEAFVKELARTDRNLLQRIFDAIVDLFEKAHNVLYSYDMTRELADAANLADKEFDKLKSVYQTALQRAENLQTDGITTTPKGTIISVESQSEIMFNKAQWENEGRSKLSEFFRKNKIDKKQADDVMGFMDMIAKASDSLEGEYPSYGNWAVYEVEIGENGAPMSAIVKNGEYTLNIDFSTKCVKRATLDRVLNKLANRSMLSLIKAKDDNTAIAVINGIIKKHGLDVACPMCFVDSKRQNILKWSKSFVDMWNWVTKQVVPKGEVISDFAFAGQNTSNTVDTLTEADFEGIENKVPRKFKTDKGNVKPILERIINLMKSDIKYIHTMTVEDMASSEGLDAIKGWSEDMYNIVNSHQGSAKPKLAHSEVPYANDIVSDRRFNAESAFMVGGVRFQSFSDYVPSLFFDYMQAVAELSAKGLPSHAYTKVIDFAKIFGKTGMKINMSGIPKVAELTTEQQTRIDSLYKDGKKSSKFHDDSLVRKLKKTAGLDADGNLLWADESIDIEEAMKLANDAEYSKNCGIVVVGVSDAHIEKLLDTEWVSMVIPYHRSGINPIVARMYNIDLFNDYTNQQNTRVPYQGKYKSINATEIKIKDFDFYGELRKLGNDPDAPKKIADRYLEWCNKAGDLSRTELAPEGKRFKPKFEKFRNHPSYYKLLADFSMKDVNGNYTPQEAVKMNFPDTQTLLGYIRDSLKTQEVREAKIDKEFDSIVDEVEEAFDIEEGVMYSKSAPDSNTTNSDESPFEILTTEQQKLPSVQLKEEVRKKINAYVEKYGELEKGAMPARNVTLPKKTSEKRYVRRNTRTIAEAEAITDENAAVLIEEVANDAGWTTYERFGDKQAIDAAVTEFERIGYDAALAKWRAVYASNKRISKQDIADVHLLIQEASKRGDKKTFVELVSNSAEIGTMSGQVVQAMFLIKRLGPAAQITALEKNIANAEEEINKKHRRSDFKFDVPQELIDEYNEALLEEEKEKREAEKEGREIDNAKKKKSDKILERIYEHMSRQVPKTWVDRITTWRYFAMLGNPRTHIRNIAGNAVFMPVVMTKHIVAALGEDGVGLIASVARRNMERTKSIRGIATIGKHWKFAGQDAKDIEDVLRGEAKYGEHKKSKIQPKPFKLAEWNNKALEFEDWVFLKPHYQIALSMYLSTNKLNPETMSIAELDKARTYAIREAQKATFRETSDLVDALSAIKHKGLRFGIDAVLPFKKTPVNILKRGVEYSPAGLLWQLKKGIVDLRKGKINAPEFIDGLASGTTGTGLLILGVFLAAKEALHGGSDDDEKEINELLGIQDYSLTIGGVNFTIDWLAPSAMPLFVGCELYKAYQTNKEKGQPWHYMFSDFADILPAITEPLFEMSMLEGLSNIVEAGAYEETTAGKLSSIAIGIPTSYLGQFVPTLLGQIARTADNTQRQTYADKNNAIPDIVEKFAIQQAKKIPGLSNLLAPAIDKKGQPRTNSEGKNIFTRALENFFSPAYINKIKSSTIDEEMQRLYDSMGEGARSVIPKSLDRYITVNGEKKDLTAKEYTKLQSTFGQTYYSKLKEIIGTDYYNNLSDENKVKLIGKAKEYSTEKAKSEADTRYRVDGWLKSAFETPGVYQYIIDTDTAEGFTEDDISDTNKESYEIGRSTTWDSVLKYYNPDGSDYDFADKYYDNLNTFAKTLNVDKYSDGQFEYSSSNKWVSTIKDWNAKEQAEYIYGRTLRSQYDDQDEANQALQNDGFITDRPRMYLLKDSFGADKSPGTLYNKYLKDSGADEITWGNLWEKYNNTPTEINGKKNDRKKIMVAEINKLRISNEQKSRMYYALGYGTSDKGLKGVPWAFVRIPEFEKESE